MAGNSFLLDTNIIVPWINKDNAIADKINKAHSVYIPVIVIGELYYGAMNSGNINKNIAKINLALSNYPHLPIDHITATEYGKIKVVLRKIGRPIPENDIWIAALAKQHDLPVVTRDKHFKEISGINVKKW